MPVRVACLLALVIAASACGDDDGGGARAGTADGGPRTPRANATCEATRARCAEFGAERPTRLSEHAAAYDPERAELIVFGGTDSVPEACTLGGPTHLLDETWIYSDPCKGWLRVSALGPSASGRHMAAWGDGNVWVFGGRYRPEDSTGPYEVYDDLFRFEVGSRSWHAVEVEGERPSRRVSGALIWDDARKRLWLFGGNQSANGTTYAPLADLWSIDPEAGRWQKHDTSGGAPSPRLFHAALYDAERDALVIFGGADAGAFTGASYSRDLWSLSLADLRWTLLSAGGSDTPSGRFWSGLVYAPDGYLLFGGHDDQAIGNRNDTWLFDPEAGSWSELDPGDTLNAAPRGACDFPPDFTAVALQAPERRAAHSLVWSEPCKHALVFGGKTDCGAIDDVWSFDGERWQTELAASEGESCVRWRDQPEECGDLCF